MQPLTDAIEALYTAFAPNRIGERIHFSPLKDYGHHEQVLLATPLRELTQDNLDPYAFSAMTTFGGVEEFRHFFPRIAELVTRQGYVGALDFDPLLRKLEYGQWTTWPERERAAIKDWLAAFERGFFDDPDGPSVGIDELWHAAQLRSATERFVDRWLAATTEAANDELGHAIVAIAEAHQKGRPRASHERPDLMPYLDAVRDALTRAKQRHPGSMAETALDVLGFPPFV